MGLPVLGLVAAAVAAAIRVGAQVRTLRIGRFRDRFLSLVDLIGKCNLCGLLCCLRCVLGAINQGRVLRSGQVGELQVHGMNRHGRVFPPARYVLLYYYRQYYRREYPRAERAF